MFILTFFKICTQSTHNGLRSRALVTQDISSQSSEKRCNSDEFLRNDRNLIVLTRIDEVLPTWQWRRERPFHWPRQAFYLHSSLIYPHFRNGSECHMIAMIFKLSKEFFGNSLKSIAQSSPIFQGFLLFKIFLLNVEWWKGKHIL